MTCRFYFVANAEAETNDSSRKTIGGKSNFTELTKKGILQARELGKHLYKLNKKFCIYSSPAIRAQQTSRYSLEEMELSPHNLSLDFSLIELDQGDWEGKEKENVHSKEVIAEIENDCWNFIPGDLIKGESQKMVAGRMLRWMKKISRRCEDCDILVFTHSYSIKYMIAEISKTDKKIAYKIPIHNASISVIEFDKVPSILSQNDFSFLED